MSSHHIIREKQEPALLVLGLDNFDDELLGQLLEWSPTLIVTKNVAEQLNAFGIKYDVLLGDANDNNELQADIKFISRESGNVTHAALEYLTANGYPAVNVITDKLILADYLPYASTINVVIFNQGKKIYPVNSGFEKWKPAGELVEIISDVAGLQLSGLQDIGNSQYITTGDGFFKLQFSDPFIFIAESIA